MGTEIAPPPLKGCISSPSPLSHATFIVSRRTAHPPLFLSAITLPTVAELPVPAVSITLLRLALAFDRPLVSTWGRGSSAVMTGKIKWPAMKE